MAPCWTGCELRHRGGGGWGGLKPTSLQRWPPRPRAAAELLRRPARGGIPPFLSPPPLLPRDASSPRYTASPATLPPTLPVAAIARCTTGLLVGLSGQQAGLGRRGRGGRGARSAAAQEGQGQPPQSWGVRWGCGSRPAASDPPPPPPPPAGLHHAASSTIHRDHGCGLTLALARGVGWWAPQHHDERGGPLGGGGV